MSAGPWKALAGRLDFSRYVPRPVEPAERSYVDLLRSEGRAGRALILKSPTDRYVQLSARDEFLWRSMDGRRSIQDLVLLYFHEFESFGFDRISVLVRQLREAGLLEDPPIEAFGSLRSRLERGKPSALASRLAGLFVEHRLEIRGLDKIITYSYRFLFRPFFTRVACTFYVALAIVGTFAFVQVLRERDYLSVLLKGGTGSGYAYGALTLLLAAALLVIFHQAAHVYAAKSLGREVPSAGFIISRGLPFFYAETTDIWMEGRRGRIMVSLAGTISDLLLGAGGGLFMYLVPDSEWNPLVFKLSFLSYGALLLDLNPLLELDGYYALADRLEIPDLRERSLRFIRRELWAKLKKRVPLSRDERIYATYGLLAAVWMVVLGIAALGLMGYQAKTAISDILSRESVVNVIKGIVVLVVFVIPISAAVLAFAALAVWKIVKWLREKARIRDSKRLLRFVMGLTAIACATVLVVPWVVREQDAPMALSLDAMGKILPSALLLPRWSLVYPAVVPALVALAAVVAFGAAREVAGSRLSRAFRYFGAFLIVECVRAAWESYKLTKLLGGGLSAPRGGDIAVDPTSPIPAWVWLAPEMAAWAALALWSLYLVLRVEFRLMPWWRKALSLLAATASIAGSVAFALQMQMPPAQKAQLAFGLSAAVLAVVNLVPTLLNYRQTLIWWGWALVLAGVGAKALSGLGRLTGRATSAGIQLDVLGAVLLLFAMILFRALLRRMSVKIHPSRASGSFSTSNDRPERAEGARGGDRARLVAALSYIVESLAENLREAVGRRSVISLEETLNRAAEREDRTVRLEAGRFKAGDLAGEGILPIAEEGRWVLSIIEREASSLAGSRFFRRLMTAVYDELYWSEREPVYEHILRDFPWADEIAHLPRPEAKGVEALIGASPLFEGLSSDERAELASRMKPRSVRAGKTIVREGDPADAFFLIADGEFEVFHEDAPEEVIAELSRGDYFGETAAEPGRHPSPPRRKASVRARTDAEALELSGEEFGRFVRAHVSVAEKFEVAAEVIELLRRMPAFRELPLAQVALIATAMRRLEADAGDAVVRQGEAGTAMYVIRSGELEVLASKDDGPLKRVAVLGPGEYFGEIALLEQVPRTATVRALTDCELLVLEKEDFDRRVGRSLAALQAMGRVSSRRRREISERRVETSRSSPRGGDNVVDLTSPRGGDNVVDLTSPRGGDNVVVRRAERP